MTKEILQYRNLYGLWVGTVHNSQKKILVNHVSRWTFFCKSLFEEQKVVNSQLQRHFYSLLAYPSPISFAKKTIMHRSIFWFTILPPPGTTGVGDDFRVKARPSGLILLWNPGGVGPGVCECPGGWGLCIWKINADFLLLKNKSRLKLVFLVIFCFLYHFC